MTARKPRANSGLIPCCSDIVCSLCEGAVVLTRAGTERARAAPLLMPFNANRLYPYGLLAAHRHGRKPSVAVILLSVHQGVKLFLDRPRDRTHAALAHLDLIHRIDGRHFRRRSGKERL